MKKYKSKYKDRINDLELIKEIFDRYGVKFYLVYGAVLGLHRDGDFIEHDDDIDLAVIDDVDLKTKKAIGWDLYDLGFVSQPVAFNVPNASNRKFRMEPIEEGYNGEHSTGIIVCQRSFKFTIFFFEHYACEEHKLLEYLCIPKLGALKLISTPAAFFNEPETILLNKKEYLIPGPVEKYLDAMYNNWKDKEDRDHSPLFYDIHKNNRN